VRVHCAGHLWPLIPNPAHAGFLHFKDRTIPQDDNDAIPPTVTAALLGVTTRTLANWEKVHYGPQPRRIGQAKIYSKEEVLAFRKTGAPMPSKTKKAFVTELAERMNARRSSCNAPR
jgi:hypothetical protein